MPELPSSKRIKYINLGLTSNDANTIVYNIEASNFFDKVLDILVSPETQKLAANYLISDIFGLMLAKPIRTFTDASPELFGDLMTLIEKGVVTSRVAKDLLEEVVFEHKDPALLIKERGLEKKNEGDLVALVESVIKENEKAVLEYREGKLPALQFLLGQGMRLSRGSADPEVLRQLFIDRIS